MELTSHHATVHCRHADSCLGCALIPLEYSAQLEHKQNAVARAVRSFSELAEAELTAIERATPIHHYRQRAKLMVGTDGAIGLYARGSHDVVDIADCQVLSAKLAQVAEALRTQLRANESRVPLLHAVDLRNVDRGVLVTLVADQGTDLASLRQFASELMQRAPEVVSVSANFREPGSVQVLGNRTIELLGSATERHHLVVAAPFHYAAHGAFTQVHGGQAAALHQTIENELRRASGTPAVNVLELYAGSGALALRLAQAGANVTAVESFAPAVERALQAAREQNIKLAAVAADAAQELEKLVRARARYDVVIVNPPRRGVSPSVRAAIAKLAPQQVFYVSCNPNTLARDLSHLARLGLLAKRITPFDMIPLTDAVEALAVIVPEQSAPHVLYEDDRLIAVVKSAHETQTELGKRVKARLSAPHALNLNELEPGTSGVSVFARDEAARCEILEAFRTRATKYLVLARGILRDKGKIERALRSKRGTKPVTRYKRLEVIAGHSLAEANCEHDGVHQIHQHLASIAHPVLGDSRFGDKRSNLHFEHRRGLDRPFVHCQRVAFIYRDQELAIEAPLAPDLELVLSSVRQSDARTTQQVSL